MRLPTLPSFSPMMMIGSMSPDMLKNSFWSRMRNAYHMLDWAYDNRAPILSDDYVTKYAPDMPPTTLTEITRKALIYFSDVDMAIDFPRPTMPNEVSQKNYSINPAVIHPCATV